MISFCSSFELHFPLKTVLNSFELTLSSTSASSPKATIISFPIQIINYSKMMIIVLYYYIHCICIMCLVISYPTESQLESSFEITLAFEVFLKTKLLKIKTDKECLRKFLKRGVNCELLGC